MLASQLFFQRMSPENVQCNANWVGKCFDAQICFFYFLREYLKFYAMAGGLYLISVLGKSRKGVELGVYCIIC